MFETIRNHRNWLLPILSAIVFLPFVFVGVNPFMDFLRDGSNTVAKIDGEPVTQQELEIAQRERIERMVQMLGPNVDTRMFDTPQARAATLENILSDKAIEHEVKHLDVAVSDARLKELIGGIPQFQVDGKFDYDTYLRLLASRGFTEASFEARVRADVGRQILESGVMSGAFVPKTVLAQLGALDSERRQVRRLAFPAQDFASKTNIDDATIKADYEANKDLYRSTEHASAQFVVLRAADLAARATITDAALHDYYDKNPARWAGVEERRASHILITAGKDGSAPDKAGARKVAEDLLRQVRAKPADFARLAKEKSKDPGSADKGGDLGWFGRAAMVKPFEDAAFALKQGQISDVVESDFGFHIIEVTGVKGAGAKPFDEVRPTIEAELRKQAAQKSYAELADQFTNFVFEQPDGLAAAAAKFGLQVQTVDNLTRQGVPQQPDKAALFTPAVIDAVFAPDSLEKHHNTKAIDVGNSSLVSVHVTQYVPSAVRPLEEIRPGIVAALQHQAAVKLAREAGEARLAQLRKAPDDAGFEPVHDLGRRDTSFLPAKAIAAIMAEPASKLPEYLGVDQADGSYAIVHVLGITHAEPSDADRAALEKSISDRVVSGEQQGYVQALRERFDARITRADLSAPAKPAGTKPGQ